jgi:hypothetical protein
LTNDAVSALSTSTNNGFVKSIVAFDLGVSADSNGEDVSVNDLIEISIPLSAMGIAQDDDVSNLIVGVLEPEPDKTVKTGETSKVSHNTLLTVFHNIVDGKLVFIAPHFSIYSVMRFESAFNDIDAHWAKKYITSLAARNVVAGRSNEEFDPEGIITRAEFIALLGRDLGLDNEVKVNYTDVVEGSWYYDMAARAGLNGITAGIENGNFRPNEAITREEIAVMIFKAYKFKNGFDLIGDTTMFVDESEISDYAFDAVNAVKANGIVSEYPDNTFKPLSNATRAEASKMMYMYMNK